MPVLALPFPPIDPVLIEIGPFVIRWYALAYIGGLLGGWWYLRRLVATPRLWVLMPPPSALDVDDLLVWMTAGVILGGRVGYILFYDFAGYLANPIEILRVWHGGMSVHGGFAGTALAQYLFARPRGLSVLTLFDLNTAAVPLGLFLGRIANFINAELYGRVTDVPWAVVFPTGGDLPRHPSQLYEAGLEGLLLGALLTILVWRGGALARPGLVAGVFGVGYGLARILVEFVREPDAQVGFLAFDTLTMGMVLSAATVVAGLALITAALTGRTGRPAP